MRQGKHRTFPGFQKDSLKHEYDSLGEEFEENEHKLFVKMVLKQ